MLKIAEQQGNVDFLREKDHHPLPDKSDDGLYNCQNAEYDYHEQQRILQLIRQDLIHQNLIEQGGDNAEYSQNDGCNNGVGKQLFMRKKGLRTKSWT